MIIQITVKDDENEILFKTNTFSFESAAEDLGRLEREVNRQDEEKARFTPDESEIEAIKAELGSIDGLSGEEEVLAIKLLTR